MTPNDPDQWMHAAPLAGGETSPNLSVARVEGIEPLDNQFDASTPKCVSDGARDALFGPPAETPDVPPLKTYAVLDAAKLSVLPELLEVSDLQFKCLFTGEAETEMRDSAPYLVELKDDSPFTRKLFTQGDLPLGLWEKELGVFIRCAAPFETLYAHLRKFLRLRGQDDNWQYLRFWEPKMFGAYFARVANRSGVTKLFAPQTLDLTFFYLQASGICDTVRANPAAQDTTPSEFTLHSDVLVDVAAHNQLELTCKTHDLEYDPKDYAGIDFKDHNTDDIMIVALMHRHFGMDPKGYDPHWFPKVSANQQKKDVLNRLLFSKKQRVHIGL